MSQCLYYAMRISALVRLWDLMRGPGQAMPPEEVDGVLDGVKAIAIQETGDVSQLADKISQAERRLVNVLKDPVYLNDDRDREIVVARMALCAVLCELKDKGIAGEQIEGLWARNECAEWCVD